MPAKRCLNKNKGKQRLGQPEVEKMPAISISPVVA
jgi:hypothetical protein